MAAMAGVLNHGTVAGQALTSPSPMAATTSSKSSSSSSSSTISANDFLTLLVTEMKNQDPTASTDPNAYINQLVSVNSLEQLININQTLTTAYPAKTTTASKDVSAESAPIAAVASATSAQSAAPALAPGNLAIPAANPSANRVAQALSGQYRTPSIPGGLGVQ